MCFFVKCWVATWWHFWLFDVSLILQWNQKPRVILMWELSNGPRIHWGDDTTKTHKHTHMLTKRKFKSRTLVWRKGTSLTVLHKVQKNGESVYKHKRGDWYFPRDYSGIDHDIHQTDTSTRWTLWLWGIMGQMPAEWTVTVRPVWGHMSPQRTGH